ncbi:hypothetical protein BJX64DRAFT_240282 [Aspergillus heterothallicus]
MRLLLLFLLQPLPFFFYLSHHGLVLVPSDMSWTLWGPYLTLKGKERGGSTTQFSVPPSITLFIDYLPWYITY